MILFRLEAAKQWAAILMPKHPAKIAGLSDSMTSKSREHGIEKSEGTGPGEGNSDGGRSSSGRNTG